MTRVATMDLGTNATRLLVADVQNGTVDSREAYRHSTDRQGFLALLKRQGLDTSFVERLA